VQRRQTVAGSPEDAAKAGELTTIATAMGNALSVYVGKVDAPAPAPSPPPIPAADTASPSPKPLGALCPAGGVVQKGFQIMGPEGMQTFDQDKRLILAMHTSAKPLIETLQEYSGRVIRGRVNPAEQLLPLVRENMRVIETDRTLDRLALKGAGETKLGIDEIFDAALATFQPAVAEKAK